MDSRTMLRECRNNSEKAWGYAYAYIISCLRRKADIPLDIQDIAQETLIYWIERGIDVTQIKNQWAFKNLLRLKANAIAIDNLRKRIRQKEEPILIQGKNKEKYLMNPKLAPVNPTVLEDMFHEQALLILETAFMGENRDCWDLVIRYFEGKFSKEKSKDMARELGLKPNTFSTRVSRCLGKLRDLPEYQNLLQEFETN